MNTSNLSQDSENRSSGEIEADIRETRSRMDATLDELGSKLTPRSLLNSALDWWESSDTGNQSSTTARKAVVGLARQAREHPMPALLIGSGIAWLISDSVDHESPGRTGNNRFVPKESGRVGEGVFQHALDTASGAMDNAKESADDLKEMVHESKERVFNRAHETMEHGKSALVRLRHEVKDGYEMGADRLGRACDEYPLAVGVGFTALGILVGLVIPRTRREDELMGERSDQLMNDTRDRAAELLETGKEIGSRVIEAVKDEAHQQGLTGDALASNISELAAKTGEVANKAKDEAVHAAHDKGITPEGGAGSIGGDEAPVASGKPPAL